MIKTLLLALIVFQSQVNSISAEQIYQISSQDFCLARWAWNSSIEEGSFWSPPFSEFHTGTLDLRSLPQQGQIGGPGGWGFFAYNQPMGKTGMHCFGSDIGDELTQNQVDTVAVVLGMKSGDLFLDSFIGIVQRLLVEFGDPTGQTQWRPIGMGRAGSVITLGDRTIAIQPLNLNSKG